jgi:HK97 family phage major capsid protein
MSEEMKKLVEDGQKALAALREAASDEKIEARIKGAADPLIEAKFQKANEALDAKLAKLEAIEKQAKANDERADALEAKLSRLGNGEAGAEKKDNGYKAAFLDFLRTGDETQCKALARSDDEVKILISANDPQAGYLVAPDEIDANVTRIVSETSPFRQYASVATIGSRAWVQNVNVGGSAARWRLKEAQAAAATAEPEFSEVRIPAEELEALYVAGHAMLDDSRVSIEQLFAQEMAIAIAELESPAFTDGDGVGKPRGILSYNTVNSASYTGAWQTIERHNTGSTSGFGTTPADPFIDAIHSLKAPYKPNARFYLNRKTLAAVRKIVDNDDRPLFQWDGSMPANIAGEPYVIFQDMPDIANGAFPVMYADLNRAYQIVDRAGLQVMRDPYSSKPSVEFYGLKRVGGGVKMFEAVKLIRTA